MTYVSVRAAAQHIARTGTLTPHQLAAFTRLDELLGPFPGIRDEFTDLWRAHGSPAAAPGPTLPPSWLAPATAMIKEFEGCRLTAYPDPETGAEPWTIGWGSTSYKDGAKVKPGDRISQVQADALLTDRLERDSQLLAKRIAGWQELSVNQQAALLSFTYNCGPHWYGSQGFSTLTRHLRNRELEQVPAALMLYVNPGGPSEAGLRRRRKAEAALFIGKPVEAPRQPAKLTPGSPFSARITPHLTLGEFALGQEARRFQQQHQVETAAELATFLERVRTQFGGKPLIITSGYRPAAINRLVGGASSSEHLYDAPSVGAVDFYVKGADINAVQAWCDKNWPYSLGYGAPKGFVHLGVRRGRPRVRWDY